MKKTNKIFFFGILAITVLMYGTALIGMQIANSIGVWIAVSASFFAIAGLVVSVVAFFIALISLLSSRMRKESVLFPALAMVAAAAFIFGVFVIPIVLTVRSRSGPEPWMTGENFTNALPQQSAAPLPRDPHTGHP